MNTKQTYNAQSIRFRRWSRAGYAVFCSLACTVTIGALAISIAEKSGIKTDNASIQIIPSSKNEFDTSDADFQELELALEQSQSIIFTQISNDATAASAINTYNSINCNG